MKTTCFRVLSAFVVFFVFSHGVEGQKRKVPLRRNVLVAPRTPAGNSPAVALPADKQKRLDSFLLAWRTIRDNYFDQTFGNLNWEDIRKEFAPRVVLAADDHQLYVLLEEMIGRLNKSHFVVIPPEVFKTINSAKRQARAPKQPIGKDAPEVEDLSEDEATDTLPEHDERSTFGIGVEVRILEDKFVISRVEKNSAAESHGLKTGYIIDKVNGVSLSDLLRRIDLIYTASQNRRLYLPLQIVNSFLNGVEDTFVDLAYIDETGTSKDVRVPRERLPGDGVSIGKNYPIQYLRYQTESLSDDVGYIRFNLFAMPVIGKFCDSLSKFKDKKALIIDLRGNIGGVLGTMVALAGMLTDDKIDLGTQLYRVGSENLTAMSQAKHFNGRIVVLVDNQSISSAEVFSAALQENGRALIVGDRTAGAALPASSVRLPTGAVMIYPIANYKTTKGNFLEGKGVEPNIPISLNRQNLLEGHDSQLDTALRLIAENSAFPKVEKQEIPIGVASPPPPVMKKAPPAALKSIASVTVRAPQVVDKPPAEVKDAESVRIISEFVQAIGGAEAFEKVKSYEMSGRAKLKVRTLEVDMNFSSLRDGKDKYGEYMSSEETGEIRQVYSGKKTFVQADYGFEAEAPSSYDISKVEILAPVNSLLKLDTFRSLSYKGVFDRSGRKSYVIEGRTIDGLDIALAFDVETKMLVSYSLGYFTVSLGDYRKVGDLVLPFLIEREPVMTIRLGDIKLNTVIDPSRFMKKQNCFNIAN